MTRADALTHLVSVSHGSILTNHSPGEQITHYHGVISPQLHPSITSFKKANL
jgi:hypothetical protein